MKQLRMAAALSALLALALVGCQGAPTASKDPVPSSQPDSSAPLASSPASTPSVHKPSSIPGLTAENCPSIDGSTANHPLIRRLYAEIYGIGLEDAETLVNLDLGSTGSIWRKIIDGNGADLSIVYEPPESLKTKFAAQLKEFEIDPIGRDGLVFLANVSNPVQSLTVEQIQQIYTGVHTDWSAVGGEKGAIQPFQRNADSGSQTLFLKLLMDGLPPMTPPTELVQQTMGGLIDGVAEFKGNGSAIGFSVYYYASLMYTYPNLKLLSVNGIAPSNASIENQTYPLTNDFYLVLDAHAPADSAARKLRDWLLSDAGRALLEEENYVWARTNLPKTTAGAGNPF